MKGRVCDFHVLCYGRFEAHGKQAGQPSVPISSSVSLPAGHSLFCEPPTYSSQVVCKKIPDMVSFHPRIYQCGSER